MGDIQCYPIEFVQRTYEILEKEYDYIKEKEDREVTFLMNCLLGLIVTVSEEENRKSNVFNGNIDDDFLALVPQKIGFLKMTHVDTDTDLTNMGVTEWNVPVGHWNDLKKIKKSWLLKKIRNGIAHQHIDGVNENGRWVGVRLWNEPVNNVKDFEIIFTIEQLRNFAIKISKKYLSEKKSKQVE